MPRKKKKPLMERMKAKDAVRGRKRAEKTKELARLEGVMALLISDRCLSAMRRATLKAGWSSNSCIDAARMICDLAKRMGLEAKCMTVEATAYNAPLWAWMIDAGWAEDQEIRDDVVMDSQAPAGSHLVVLGARSIPAIDEDHWRGHCVVVLGVGGKWSWAVDLTVDQAQRTKKELPLTPLAFRVDQPWLEGENRVVQVRRKVLLDRGTRPAQIAVEYRAFPDDETYQDSPAWGREYGATITADDKGIQFHMNPLDDD